jgi:predicted TIM-barrel fold metal-dependent hydrolase
MLLLSAAITGCQSGYYSEKDFQSVLKIDSHFHINSESGFSEDQAVNDNFRLMSIVVDHSDSLAISDQLKFVHSSVKRYPGKVFYATSFYFDTAGWQTDEWSRKVISQLERDISNGAVSVKLWKNIGMTVRNKDGKFIMVDDPYLKPVIDFIVSKNIPVTGHLGEPRNCWLPLNEMTVRGDSSYFAENPQYHMFLHPEYPSYEQQIDARDHLLELHPGLTFIGCHLGSLEWNVDSLSARLDKFPDMAVDLAARICHLQYQSAKDRERVRNFCIKYQDRLLYGTDLSDDGNRTREEIGSGLHKTWINDWKYFTSDHEMSVADFSGKFTGLKLPKEVVNKIYSENAIRLYKLNVK